MPSPFENLHGSSGLLTFLNHPMREPQFEKDSLLEIEYKRLFEETYNEQVSFSLLESIAFRTQTNEIKFGCMHGLKNDILNWAKKYSKRQK